jgi:hypothetical protein
MAISGA